MKKIVVLGGGISGLVTALEATRKGFLVSIIETSNRLGGWIQTVRHEDGTHFELGPRTVSATTKTGKFALQYAESIGLSDMVIGIPKTNPAASKRLIVYDHELHEVQMGLKTFILGGNLIKKPLLMSLLKDFTTKKKPLSDDSFYNFFERRFGKELADKLVDPICKGITGGDSKKISIKLIMNKLFEYEQKYGSVTQGMMGNLFSKSEDFNSSKLVEAKEKKWQMWTLKGGMETFIDKLHEELAIANVVIHQVDDYNVHLSPGVATVELPNETITGNHLISAIPAHSLIKLLGKTCLQNFTEPLLSLNTVDIGLVNLEYEDCALPVEGFGYLIASTENTDVLGVTFDTCAVPMGNKTIMTVMIGGSTPAKTTEDLLQTARSEIGHRLGISKTPCRYKVTLLEKCIPQYHVGYYKTIEDFRKLIASTGLPLSVIGASFNGISIADLIQSSCKQIDELIKTLQ